MSAIARPTSFPARFALVFNIRFNDVWTPARLSAEIERRVAAAIPGARYELTFDPTNAVAFLTPRGAFTDLVARAIEEATGRAPRLSTSGGTSDARFIKDACPVVEIGLVRGNMHGIDEHADIADLETLSRIYGAGALFRAGGVTAAPQSSPYSTLDR